MTDRTDEKRLDLEMKAKWLSALRSGRYKQGQNKLRTREDCYCCLGVLGDIYDPGMWRKDDDEEWLYGLEGSSDDAELLGYIRNRFGLSYDAMNRCMEMNDGKKDWSAETHEYAQTTAPMSFSEIADWIEANL